MTKSDADDLPAPPSDPRSDDGGAPLPSGDVTVSEWLRDLAPLAPTSIPVPSQLGPYEVLEMLGRGGMGSVYRALDRRLGREVALKVQHRASGPETLARIYREARALARLQHPALVGVHGIEEIDGRLLISMELVRGVTLRKRLESVPAPALELRMRWARELLAGMAEAHRRGVAHRDLKPGNVLVDEHERVRIVDFGLAKIQREPVRPPLDVFEAWNSRPELRLGTEGYMAPEQERGDAVTPRADVYALGLVMFEILTGMQLAEAPHRSGALSSHDLGVLVRAVPDRAKALADVLARALVFDADARLPDAGALLRALDSALPAPRRSSRRAAIGLAIAAVLALALALVVALVPRQGPPLVEVLEDRRLDLVANDVIVDVALAPDARHLAFVMLGGAVRVRALPSETASSETLTTELHVEHVSWLGARELVLSGRDARGEPRVESRALGDPNARWTGRGSAAVALGDEGRIAFVRDGMLFSVDRSGTEVQHGALGPALLRGGLGASPDGRYVLVPRAGERPSIDAFDLRTGRGWPLVEATEILHSDLRTSLWWSREGLYLVRRTASAAELVIASFERDANGGLALGAHRVIASWPEVGASCLTLSADGRRALLLVVSTAHRTELRRLDEDARGQVTLSPASARRHRAGNRVSDWLDDEALGMVAPSPSGWSAFRDGLTETTFVGDGSAAWTWPTRAPDGALLVWRNDLERGVSALVRWSEVGASPPISERRGPIGPAPPPGGARLRCARAPGGGCVLAEMVESTLVFRDLDPARGVGPTRLMRQPAPFLAELEWDLSPDGRHIVHPTRGATFAIDGAPAGPALAPCDNAHRFAWDPRGRGIWTVIERDACDARRSLVLFDLEGQVGAREEFGPFARPVYLAASPDGAHLAITVAEEIGRAHLLELGPRPR